VPSFHTEQYRHSFFVKTVIDWNHLADDIVDVPSCEAFRNRLANSQS